MEEPRQDPSYAKNYVKSLICFGVWDAKHQKSVSLFRGSHISTLVGSHIWALARITTGQPLLFVRCTLLHAVCHAINHVATTLILLYAVCHAINHVATTLILLHAVCHAINHVATTLILLHAVCHAINHVATTLILLGAVPLSECLE